MKLERRLHWDGARKQFGNGDEANCLLSRAMRSPWCGSRAGNKSEK